MKLLLGSSGLHILGKSLSRALLITLFVGGLILISNMQFNTVQASTEVTGIISSDTTWAKANSPYALTGNVIVDEGVTLTIEPGVSVYFNSYFICVNGTLFAKGTQTDKITMTGAGISYSGEWMGRIVFSNSSTNSTLEYAQITSSPDVIIGVYSATVTTISNNTIGGTEGTAIYIKESSPILLGNVISGNGADGILIEGPHSSPIISENTVSNNTVTGIDVFYHGSPTIKENTITGNRYGITLFVAWEGDSATISDNILSNNTDGIHFFFFNKASFPYLVTRNLITNSTNAIMISVQYNFAGSATIIGNVLTGNTNAIVVQYSSPSDDIKINQNNIYGNTQYNLLVNTGWSLDATNNWWGTTDLQAINQTISDTRRVKYIPFLTAPNSEATPIPEFPSWTLLLLLVVAVVTIIVIFRNKLNKQNRERLDK